MYYITRSKSRIILSISSERNAVVAFPCSSATRPCLSVQVASSLQSTVFSTSSGYSTQLTMLVHRVGDPVNSRVVTNGSMGWVYENDLKVLVDSIFIDPV